MAWPFSKGSRRQFSYLLIGALVLAICLAVGSAMASNYSVGIAAALAIGVVTASMILSSRIARAPVAYPREARDALRRVIAEMSHGDLSAETPDFAPEGRLLPNVEALEAPNAKTVAHLQIARGAEAASDNFGASPEQLQAAIERLRDTVGVAMGQVSANAERFAQAADRLTGVVHQSARRAKSVFESAQASWGQTHGLEIASRTLGAALKSLESRVLSMRELVGEMTRASASATRAIDQLASRGKDIGEISGAIQTTAAQTNSLALQGTIEAARSAEASGGFAIVAHEVKALADQTKRATERIAEHAVAIQEAAAAAVDAIAKLDAVARQTNGTVEFSAAANPDRSQVASENEPGSAEPAAGAGDAFRSIGDLGSAASERQKIAAELGVAPAEAATEAKILRETFDKFLLSLGLF